MTRVEKIVSLFRHRFIQRDDCYPVQYGNNGGGYTVVKAKLTDDVILSHLRGGKTIGLYGSPDSMTKWLCIDIDILDEVAVREVQNHLRRFNIPHLTEFSGKKGYHIWVFFDKPYPNHVARVLASAVAFEHEIFPKQDRVGEGKLGNLIKAPLGKHQATENWCLFLDKDLQPEKDQYGTLAGIRPINPLEIIKASIPEIWHKLNAQQQKYEMKTSFDAIKLPIIKDCVKAAIFQGSKQGVRNQVGHIIATELRNTGIEKAQAESILWEIWNPRNQSSLSAAEISVIVNSAYQNGNYVYGCKEDGQLRKLLECCGHKNCLYVALLKALSDNESFEKAK
jgi:hypothetical protein